MKIPLRKKIWTLTFFLLGTLLTFYITSCGEVASIQKVKIIGAGR